MKSNCVIFDKYYDFKITLCSLFIIILITLLVLLSLFCKFEFVTSYNGLVRLEDDYYVYLLLDDNEISDIQKQDLVLDKKRLDYKIVKFDSEYVLTDYGPKRGLYLDILLNDEDKIVNNVVELNFVCRKTIFERLKENFV